MWLKIGTEGHQIALRKVGSKVWQGASVGFEPGTFSFYFYQNSTSIEGSDPPFYVCLFPHFFEILLLPQEITLAVSDYFMYPTKWYPTELSFSRTSK